MGTGSEIMKCITVFNSKLATTAFGKSGMLRNRKKLRFIWDDLSNHDLEKHMSHHNSLDPHGRARTTQNGTCQMTKWQLVS